MKNENVTISLEKYNHLYDVEKASKNKTMYLKGYCFNGSEYYCFTDVQKDLFDTLHSAEKEIKRLRRLNREKQVNQSFIQKLKNLFR